MKLAKLAYLLTVSLTLSLATVGCRKGLDKTTQIPGRGQPAISDSPAPSRDLAPGGNIPTGTGPETTGVTPTPIPFDPTKGQGIEAAKGDFSNWSENRDEFAAQTVYFDFDKSVVKGSEVGKLEEVAARMKNNFAGKALRIEGHCDERGTEEYNRALGDRRALSIREKLVQLGLDPEMLPTISFGEDKPADLGHNDAAFAKNRRAELILLSPPGSN
jgi:peptidoglycan-associated lipoprotein